MDVPILISSLRVQDYNEPAPNGDRVIARFDLRLPHVDVRHCALVKTKRGYFTVEPPTTQMKSGAPLVTLSKPRAAIIEKALAAYRAMGGEHGEFNPTWKDQEANNGDRS